MIIIISRINSEECVFFGTLSIFFMKLKMLFYFHGGNNQNILGWGYLQLY